MMKKREVIFYSGFSMEPPEQVELLENNRGTILASSFDEKEVDVPDYKILSFWDRIEEIGVWKWHKKYPYSKSLDLAINNEKAQFYFTYKKYDKVIEVLEPNVVDCDMYGIEFLARSRTL